MALWDRALCSSAHSRKASHRGTMNTDPFFSTDAKLKQLFLNYVLSETLMPVKSKAVVNRSYCSATQKPKA